MTKPRPRASQAGKDRVARLSTEIAAQTKGDAFGRFAASASSWLGSKWAFAAAVAIILGWGATGPIFHFSDTWQLIINTGTTTGPELAFRPGAQPVTFVPWGLSILLASAPQQSHTRHRKALSHRFHPRRTELSPSRPRPSDDHAL